MRQRDNFFVGRAKCAQASSPSGFMPEGRDSMVRASNVSHAILPVGALPVNGVPQSGEEYLAMVRCVDRIYLLTRHEANLQPRILAHAGCIDAPAAVATAPRIFSDAYLPTAEWRSVFVERFNRLHQVRQEPGTNAGFVRRAAHMHTSHQASSCAR